MPNSRGKTPFFIQETEHIKFSLAPVQVNGRKFQFYLHHDNYYQSTFLSYTPLSLSSRFSEGRQFPLFRARLYLGLHEN